ncbi:MAG: adenylate kinase [Thermomicrobiales bacterium]
MNIILMGPQGSGKGTQADRLLPLLGLTSIATGELFRHAAKAGTPLGLRAKALMDQGELVPDDVTVGLVEERLDAIDGARRAGERIEGALFDGFPRTLTQAVALDEALVRRGQQVDRVILIDVDRVQLIERLGGRRTCPNCNDVYHVIYNPPKVEGICNSCGSALIQRADDTPEAVERRLDTYYKVTAPLLQFYEERGLLARVDGSQAIDDVTEAVTAAIGRIGASGRAAG